MRVRRGCGGQVSFCEGEGRARGIKTSSGRMFDAFAV
jgi:hypothetical protein